MRRRVVAGLGLVALIVAVVVVSGRGGSADASAVRSVVHDYNAAMATGNGSEACGYLTGHASTQLIYGGGACEQALTSTASYLSEQQRRALDAADIHVQVTGARAVATFTPAGMAESRFALVRSETTWSISDLGASGSATASAPNEPKLRFAIAQLIEADIAKLNGETRNGDELQTICTSMSSTTFYCGSAYSLAQRVSDTTAAYEQNGDVQLTPSSGPAGRGLNMTLPAATLDTALTADGNNTGAITPQPISGPQPPPGTFTTQSASTPASTRDLLSAGQQLGLRWPPLQPARLIRPPALCSCRPGAPGSSGSTGATGT